MIDKIIVNTSRTKATIYYTSGRVFNLYHSQGLVLDLVAFFITPMTTSKDITWKGLQTSEDDTVSIEVA